jgi:hypothetical protein
MAVSPTFPRGKCTPWASATQESLPRLVGSRVPWAGSSRPGRTVSRADYLGSGRGSPPGRSAARRRAACGSSVLDTGEAPRGTGPREGWAGLSGRSRPGEPVCWRNLLGRPFDDLRPQPLLLAVADEDPLQVRDLLRRPFQQLPPVRRRVLVQLAGRRLPGVAPIRSGGRPGRGMLFRVERLLDGLARVVRRKGLTVP